MMITGRLTGKARTTIPRLVGAALADEDFRLRLKRFGGCHGAQDQCSDDKSEGFGRNNICTLVELAYGFFHLSSRLDDECGLKASTMEIGWFVGVLSESPVLGRRRLGSKGASARKCCVRGEQAWG